MRENANVKVELEAEDTLAVRLMSLKVEGAMLTGSTRVALELQTRAILDNATVFEGGLALIEVDGVSNAVLMRTPTPSNGRFVQIILRNGNTFSLETRGGATHLSRENYERLLTVLSELFPEGGGN